MPPRHLQKEEVDELNRRRQEEGRPRLSDRNARRQARRPTSSQRQNNRAQPYATTGSNRVEERSSATGTVGEQEISTWPLSSASSSGDLHPGTCAGIGACAGFGRLELETSFHLPGYSPNCQGTPAMWNDAQQGVLCRYAWNKKKQEAQELKPKPIIPHTQRELAQQFLKTFFSTRPGLQGECLLCKLGAPEILDGVWTKFPILQPASGSQPDSSWLIGRHGSRLECLYSILALGKLQESQCEEDGDRYFERRPGIYLHNLDSSHKIRPYLTWVWVEGSAPGGDFARAIAIQFQALYNPEGSNRRGKRTDQIIMKENAVRLSHVLLGMKQNLEPGEYAQTGWSPHAEANPFKRLSRDARG